jgi:hypothetical protein
MAGTAPSFFFSSLAKLRHSVYIFISEFLSKSSPPELCGKEKRYNIVAK